MSFEHSLWILCQIFPVCPDCRNLHVIKRLSTTRPSYFMAGVGLWSDGSSESDGAQKKSSGLLFRNSVQVP